MSGAVLVTGATGFIGRHLLDALVAEGRPVIAAVRSSDASLPAKVERVLVGDWGEGASPALRAALARADAVVHLAGRAHHVREAAPDPLAAYRRAHVDTTLALLAAAEDTPVRRVVLLSTVAAAVAETRAPVGDDVTPAPATPYGVSKREMEVAAAAAAGARGLEAVTLRPPMVYGPGMKGNPERLLRLVAARRPIPVAVPSARRSALYVGNLVQAIGLALRARALDARPYFVSDGPAPSVLEFVDAMAAGLETRARILRLSRDILHAIGRVGDVVARVIPVPVTSYEMHRLTGSLELDSSRFWRASGEAPRHDLREGMRATGQWFRARRAP